MSRVRALNSIRKSHLLRLGALQLMMMKDAEKHVSLVLRHMGAAPFRETGEAEIVGEREKTKARQLRSPSRPNRASTENLNFHKAKANQPFQNGGYEARSFLGPRVVAEKKYFSSKTKKKRGGPPSGDRRQDPSSQL